MSIAEGFGIPPKIIVNYAEWLSPCMLIYNDVWYLIHMALYFNYLTVKGNTDMGIFRV